jgi:REP element-mobilizing transposase RayT
MERQLEFDFPEHGGRREGAGRKQKGEKAMMPHKKREEITRADPLLITARMAADLPTLRRSEEMKIARSALKAARDRNGMRVIHYSVQGNHLHLIVEAEDRSAVARGMNGLLVRLTKGLNKLWQREGKVFPDRFHDEVLTTPTQTRNALRYVLQNGKKHGVVPLYSIDPCSSGLAFDGWTRPSIVPHVLDTVVPATAWLLTNGWQRHGLIGLDEVPRRKRKGKRSAERS